MNVEPTSKRSSMPPSKRASLPENPYRVVLREPKQKKEPRPSLFKKKPNKQQFEKESVPEDDCPDVDVPLTIEVNKNWEKEFAHDDDEIATTKVANRRASAPYRMFNNNNNNNNNNNKNNNKNKNTIKNTAVNSNNNKTKEPDAPKERRLSMNRSTPYRMKPNQEPQSFSPSSKPKEPVAVNERRQSINRSAPYRMKKNEEVNNNNNNNNNKGGTSYRMTPNEKTTTRRTIFPQPKERKWDTSYRMTPKEKTSLGGAGDSNHSQQRDTSYRMKPNEKTRVSDHEKNRRDTRYSFTNGEFTRVQK